MWRDLADLGLGIEKPVVVEVLRIGARVVDGGENLEFGSPTRLLGLARSSVRNTTPIS